MTRAICRWRGTETSTAESSKKDLVPLNKEEKAEVKQAVDAAVGESGEPKKVNMLMYICGFFGKLLRFCLWARRRYKRPSRGSASQQAQKYNMKCRRPHELLLGLAVSTVHHTWSYLCIH